MPVVGTCPLALILRGSVFTSTPAAVISNPKSSSSATSDLRFRPCFLPGEGGYTSPVDDAGDGAPSECVGGASSRNADGYVSVSAAAFALEKSLRKAVKSKSSGGGGAKEVWVGVMHDGSS